LTRLLEELDSTIDVRKHVFFLPEATVGHEPEEFIDKG
jgi:hypothetical protein